LGRICTLIGEQNANISDVRFTERKPDFFRIRIDVEVRDVEHLHNVMMAVEADVDVAGLERTRELGRLSQLEATQPGTPREKVAKEDRCSNAG